MALSVEGFRIAALQQEQIANPISLNKHIQNYPLSVFMLFVPVYVLGRQVVCMGCVCVSVLMNLISFACRNTGNLPVAIAM